MTSECVSVERIAEVLELPADDALRVHVEGCPRCSSLLASYLSFIEAVPAADANPAEADARLMEFLHDRIGAVAPASPSTDPAPDGNGFLARVRAWVNTRPAWVAAALALLVAAVLWWQPWDVEQPELRSVSSLPLLKMDPPKILSDGAVRLGWEGEEDATQYRIILYDKELKEIVRLDSGQETTIDLIRDKLPSDIPSVVICRVAALQDGDEIAETAPVLVELP